MSMRRVSAPLTDVERLTWLSRVPLVSTRPVGVKVTDRLLVVEAAVTPGTSPLARDCSVAAGLTCATVQPAPLASSVKLTLLFGARPRHGRSWPVEHTFGGAAQAVVGDLRGRTAQPVPAPTASTRHGDHQFNQPRAAAGVAQRRRAPVDARQHVVPLRRSQQFTGRPLMPTKAVVRCRLLWSTV